MTPPRDRGCKAEPSEVFRRCWLRNDAQTHLGAAMSYGWRGHDKITMRPQKPVLTTINTDRSSPNNTHLEVGARPRSTSYETTLLSPAPMSEAS